MNTIIETKYNSIIWNWSSLGVFSFGRACSDRDLNLSHTWTSDIVSDNRDQSHAWAVVEFFYSFLLSACFSVDVSVLHGLLR